MNQLPILQHPELIRRLKGKVTTEPGSTFSQPTGIPPHINHAILLDKLLSVTSDTLNHIISMTESIQETVRDAIEMNDHRSGQVTMAVLDEKLTTMKAEIIKAVEVCTSNRGLSDNPP